ncbi:MAG TPA: hypothetical protein VFA43_20935, partial [Gemmatimonadaceae bacterium]|nr:hypothetical protein [Gemmatimonadaceae bacterium]
MGTLLRVFAWLAFVVVLVIAIAFSAVMILTRSDFGRERTRTIALGFAQKAIHGNVHIGQLSGNLLANPTIDSLSITDSSGAPFLSAHRVSFHYGLGSILHQRLNFRQMEVDDPVIVLDQSAAGTWNFSRIFPSSNTPTDTSKHGFGDWITIRGLRIVNARVILKKPYKPDSAPPNPRLVIVDGEQITEVDRLNAMLPYVRVADPVQKTKQAQIATLNADLALFKPPIARIDDLAATINLDNDSLWFRGARLAMPGSSVRDISTNFGIKTGDLTLDLRATPVALSALRFAYPPLPTQGTLAAAVGVRWRGKGQDYAVRGL